MSSPPRAYRLGSLIFRHTDDKMRQQFGIVCEVNGGDGFRVFWSINGRHNKWRYAEMFERANSRGMLHSTWYEVLVY